jgi:hypothetical protein
MTSENQSAGATVLLLCHMLLWLQLCSKPCGIKRHLHKAVAIG